ncbi:MAG: hypothetical protein ABFD97_00655 [Syntrophobacter sp.]
MEQMQLAKQIFELLIRTFQMFKLYPETSQNRQQALVKLNSELASFLAEHGSLGFEIHKKAVSYLGDVIYEQSGRVGDCVSTLYQEGIQWLEFLDGVGLDELEKLLMILDEYSRPVSSGGAEEDLVTRLWDLQLDNIVFQDIQDDEDLLPEFEQNRERTNFLKEKSIPQICAYLLALPEDPEYTENAVGIDAGAWELQPQEELLLQKEKQEDHSFDPLAEVLGVLAHVSEQEREFELLASLLDFLRDGTTQALKALDINGAGRILMTVRELRKTRDEDHWASGLLDGFVVKISESESVSSLIAGIKDPENSGLDALKKFLMSLHPRVIHAIIPTLPEVWSPSLRKVLIETITAQAAVDVEQLRGFPKNFDEKLAFVLIEVLSNLKTGTAAEILLEYMDHQSDEVVFRAIRALAGMDRWFPQPVFKLIDHHSIKIRKTALEYLASKKSETSERLLISYLTSESIKGAEKDFALQCFRALGSCGSSLAYSFFRGILMNRKWYRKLFKSVETEGAALGLRMIGVRGNAGSR